jgi:hypothetical protein
MLRERRKQSPGGKCLSLDLNNNQKLRKRDTMEIVKGIRDLAFVAVFAVTALSPRVISAYRALREAE